MAMITVLHKQDDERRETVDNICVHLGFALVYN